MEQAKPVEEPKRVLTGPYTEFQSVPEQKDSPKSRSDLKFDDISLFSVIDSDNKKKNKKLAGKSSLYPGEMARLAHSTCELTSVVENSTDVSSKAMNKKSAAKFTLQINIPSTIQNLDSRQNSRQALDSASRGQELKKRNQSSGPAPGRGNPNDRTLTNSSNVNCLHFSDNKVMQTFNFLMHLHLHRQC